MGFAQKQQIRLFDESLSPWMRKGTAWLDVNCGDGCFLPSLLRKGCNVEATEADATLREQARQCVEGKSDIAATSDDNLPYADNYFDFAVLHVGADTLPRLGRAVEELARVAERGIAVAFWNSASLGSLGKPDCMTASLPWWQVRRVLKGLGRGQYAVCGTLWLPAGTWQEGSSLANLNGLCCGLPIGAWMLAKLDLNPQRTGTPLALRVPWLRSGNVAMDQ